MRVAIATVGTHGDIAPFALLGETLADRGHEVTAVTWPVHHAALDRPGIRVQEAGPHADAQRINSLAAEISGLGPLEQVARLRDFHLADGEAHYRALRDRLAGYDLVVLHTIHVLAHAAVLDLGARWASATFDPVLLPTRRAPPPGMPPLGPLNRVAWSLLERSIDRQARPLDSLLDRAGSRQRSMPLFRARSPRLHLVACSPTIIRVPDDLSPTMNVTGAWLDRRPMAALPVTLESFIAEGAPPVVIAFGSMAGPPAPIAENAVRRVLAAGRRVVVQGRFAGTVTSPSLLHIGAVDHRALFPRAALVVHHGGAGTTHAVAAAGVPSVVAPHIGDQRYWGDRLRRLGVAPPPLLLSRLSAGTLVDAILTAAADHGMGDRARSLAAMIRHERGLETAGAAIEAQSAE